MSVSYAILINQVGLFQEIFNMLHIISSMLLFMLCFSLFIKHFYTNVLKLIYCERQFLFGRFIHV